MIGKHDSQRHYFQKGDIAYIYERNNTPIQVEVVGSKFTPQMQGCDEVYIKGMDGKQRTVSSIDLYLSYHMARIASQPKGKRVWYFGSPNPKHYHSARIVGILKTHKMIAGYRHVIMSMRLDNGKVVEPKGVYLSQFEIRKESEKRIAGIDNSTAYETIFFGENGIDTHAFKFKAGEVLGQVVLN